MHKALAISNPTHWRFEITEIRNRCDFSCDFHATSQRIQRQFGCDFAERSPNSNRAILLRFETAAIVILRLGPRLRHGVQIPDSVKLALIECRAQETLKEVLSHTAGSDEAITNLEKWATIIDPWPAKGEFSFSEPRFAHVQTASEDSLTAQLQSLILNCAILAFLAQGTSLSNQGLVM